MKKFLKNVNRGIVLLIVVVIGFTGYVIYDNASFKANKPAIEKMLQEYCGEIAKLNLLPEEYRDKDADLPQGVMDSQLKQNMELINRYWTTQRTPNTWGGKDQLRYNMEYMLDTMKTEGGRILDFELGFRGVEDIKKIAPGTARVTLSFYMNFDAVGNCQYFDGFQTNELSYFDYNSDPSQLNDGKVRSYSSTRTNAEITVIKTSDGWKISGISSMWYEDRQVQVKDDGAAAVPEEGGVNVGK